MNNSGDFENYEEFSQKQRNILELKLISMNNEEIAEKLSLSMDELEREINEMTKIFDEKKKKE